MEHIEQPPGQDHDVVDVEQKRDNGGAKSDAWKWTGGVEVGSILRKEVFIQAVVLFDSSIENDRKIRT